MEGVDRNKGWILSGNGEKVWQRKKEKWRKKYQREEKPGWRKRSDRIGKKEVTAERENRKGRKEGPERTGTSKLFGKRVKSSQ